MEQVRRRRTISPDGASLVFARHTHLGGTSNFYLLSLDLLSLEGIAKSVEEPRLLFSGDALRSQKKSLPQRTEGFVLREDYMGAPVAV